MRTITPRGRPAFRGRQTIRLTGQTAIARRHRDDLRDRCVRHPCHDPGQGDLGKQHIKTWGHDSGQSQKRTLTAT